MSIPADQALAIAISHHQAGRFAEAEGIYRQLLSANRNHLRVLDLLSYLCLQTARPAVAQALLQRAIELDPTQPTYRSNLGEALRRLGKYEQAVEAYRAALAIDSSIAAVHSNLGIALAESGQIQEAIASFHKAVELAPDYADAWCNLSNAYNEAAMDEQALSAAEQAVAMCPASAVNHNTLAVALAAVGRYPEAIAAYRRATSLNPGYVDAWSNLGNALAAEGQTQEALAASGKAVELDPGSLQSHWNYAVVLLRSGDLARGWAEYEWRWTAQTRFPRVKQRFNPPRFPTPMWDGAKLGGRIILLHAEQGFGDTIHFARYAPMVADRGGKVVIEAQPECYRLLRSLRGIETVIVRGEPVPPFDAHCPLMSLGRLFGTTLDSIPAEIPYLSADESDAAAWQRKLGPSGGRLRVGLCWAGSPTHSDDDKRTIALAQLAPLASEGIEFHCLQKGPAAAAAQHPPAGMTLQNHADALTDFAETAALIANLDLVITVDTAVGHLAGALGKPVWMLVRSLSDWRWLTDREDTPWYPTMRLFRQKRPGDWAEAIDRVAAALRDAAQAQTSSCWPRRPPCRISDENDI